jgi:hypothetical protein
MPIVLKLFTPDRHGFWMIRQFHQRTILKGLARNIGLKEWQRYGYTPLNVPSRQAPVE